LVLGFWVLVRGSGFGVRSSGFGVRSSQFEVLSYLEHGTAPGTGTWNQNVELEHGTRKLELGTVILIMEMF
jgi:hypothetical protein